MGAETPEEGRDVNRKDTVGLVVAFHTLGETVPIKKQVTRMTHISGTERGKVMKIAGLTPEKMHHYLKIKIRLTILIMYFINFYLYYLHLMMLIYHV